MSTRKYDYTLVKNVSGSNMDFGWLGENGVNLDNNETFKQEGLLPAGLRPKQKEAYNNAMDNGYVQVQHVPCGEQTDGQYKGPVIVEQEFGGTDATGSDKIIFDGSVPSELRIVDAHVIVKRDEIVSTHTHKAALYLNSERSSTGLISDWVAITGGTGQKAEFGTIKPSLADLDTGSSLYVGLTAQTGPLPAGTAFTGTMYITAIPRNA